MKEFLWKVDTEEGVVTFTGPSLSKLLSGTLSKLEQPAMSHLIGATISSMSKDTLTVSSIRSLFAAGFMMGYAYKVFLTKNKVIVEEIPDVPAT